MAHRNPKADVRATYRAARRSVANRKQFAEHRKDRGTTSRETWWSRPSMYWLGRLYGYSLIHRLEGSVVGRLATPRYLTEVRTATSDIST